MKNEAGPNFIGYFKHLTSELLMDSEMLQIPFPEFKKERLKAILNESVDCLTQETDRINDQIIAKLHMELDSSDKKKLSSHSHKSDERINGSSRKRKASSIASKDSGDANILIQNPIGKVHNDPQVLQGNAEIGKDLQKNSAELQEELDKMEQGLEEFINDIFSKCRPMSGAEKELLGRLIKKLPEKAFDRVVEIVLRNKPSEAEPSEVFVDLETQDNITLWRLYYYVQTVLKVNKLSNRGPIPFPLSSISWRCNI
ncbi:uncharacterized protein LOC110030800 isoform X2 [Phalaenopsis equestris]|nr:uncharacterized protein LOC110030800 isoform X2 [Phalaenopsis equestris]XP_020589384.1 uncharacterized protein LOC110030800 isoform X2 [Phalaenopsis equestris]